MNIADDFERVVFCCDFIQGRDFSDVWNIFVAVIDVGNRLQLFVRQKTFRAFSRDKGSSVDEKHFAFSFVGLLRATDEHARFHRRIVEEIFPDADDALDEITIDHAFAHPLFFLAIQDAVRQEHGAASRLRVHAFENVLDEGEVRAILIWHAEEVAPVFVAGECFAIPLADGVRRI